MQETITKQCNVCKETKSIDSFNMDKTRKDGYSYLCKQCTSEAYKRHQLKRLESKKDYYYNNRDFLLEKNKKDRKEDPERFRKYEATKYKKHKDKILEANRKYIKTEIGKASKKNRSHRRRSMKRAGDVTNDQLIELQKNAKVCYWCNEPLKNKVIHIDHYTPLAKGGEHTLGNLVVCCNVCNLKKHAKDPIVFANMNGKLL